MYPALDNSRDLVLRETAQAKRLLLVINEPGFFLTHRANLALAAEAAGYEVHVATPQVDDWQAISRAGFRYHPVVLERWGTSAFQDITAVLSLISLYRRLKPTIVQHVSIKPVLYGSIAAQIAKVPAVVNAVSGLGYVFLSDGLAAKFRRLVVRFLYKLAAKHNSARFIVQNPDDFRLFEEQKLVPPSKLILVPGSGVDENRFPASELPLGEPVVLMVSRVLRDKGITEFVQAARILRSRGIQARFLVVGAHPVGNPSAIPVEEFERWKQEGIVEFIGHQESTFEWLRQSSLVCLPSYREGLPKALIEALAVGRAIVSTDVPGCRELVDHGVNGRLVPPRNAEALANSLEGILSDKPLLSRMGQESRRMFEERRYSERHVLNRLLNIYEELLFFSV